MEKSNPILKLDGTHSTSHGEDGMFQLGGAWGAEGQGGVEKCEDVILFHEKEDPIMNLIYNKQNCHQVSMAIHCI